VGGDKWGLLSFACLATRSVDSFVGLPRLYETVVQEGQGGGWEGDMGRGWAGRLPAGGWEKGSRVGFEAVLNTCPHRSVSRCGERYRCAIPLPH
jgi:hypothetical protein